MHHDILPDEREYSKLTTCRSFGEEIPTNRQIRIAGDFERQFTYLQFKKSSQRKSKLYCLPLTTPKEATTGTA